MTLDELVTEIEKLFDCINGDYRAFHQDPQGNRYPYISLGFFSKPQIPMESLRAALLNQFTELRAEYGPTLYWRYGQGHRILEDYQTAAMGRLALQKITTRVAIPGLDHKLFSLEGKPYPEVFDDVSKPGV